jgi:pyruvate formate lyase activating enzyme
MPEGRGAFGDRSARPPLSPTPLLSTWRPALLGSWPGRLAATAVLGPAGDASGSVPIPLRIRSGPSAAAWVDLIRYLEASRDWTDGVVVCGHEPTADPDLPSLLAALTDRGFPVCLRTDGTRPDVVGHLVAEQLVAAVSVEVRAPADGFDGLDGSPDAARRIRETRDLVLAGGVEHEFRTRADTVAVAPVELPSIARSVKGARLYVIERTRTAAAANGPATTLTDLRAIARACSVHVPTVIREVA